jgi:riboflavin synthase
MRIGLADTCFSQVDMAKVALEVFSGYEIERYTVPGFKDLPVACKRLLTEFNCDIVLALGWVGGEDIDETCAHEANQGLIMCEVLTGKHIIKCFVHKREGDDQTVKRIAINRTREHAKNVLSLLKGKEELTPNAGKGLRQGSENAGELQ